MESAAYVYLAVALVSGTLVEIYVYPFMVCRTAVGMAVGAYMYSRDLLIVRY